MMIYLFVRHHVNDHAQWKEGFDNHLAIRQAGGANDAALVLQNVDNPLEIIVILGWHDLMQAKTFTQSVSWHMSLQKMGVVGMPEVCFLETAVQAHDSSTKNF